MEKRFYFESCSAGFIEPKDYIWFEYKGSKPLNFEHPNRKRNRRHDLVLSKGDVFGIREKRTGGFNLVKSDMMHVIFKMHDYDMDLIEKRSKITKKIPKKQTGTPPRARTKTGTQPRFKKRGVSATREKTQINKSDYQWRVVQDEVELKSPNNKPRFKLKKNQKVGIRFVNAAKGGFLVTESGHRIRISTKSFDEVMMKSSIMETQPKGTIDVDQEALRKEKIRADKDKKKHLTSPTSKRKKKVTDENLELGDKEGKLSRIRRRKMGTPREDLDEALDEPKEKKRKPAPKKRSGLRRRRVDPNASIKDIDEDIQLEDEYKETVKDDMKDDEPKEVRRMPRRRVKPGKINTEEGKDDHREDAIQEANDFDVGDVVVFFKDKKQREYVILDERPSEKSDSITEYIIYNLTEEPDYLQKFMQSTKSVRLSKLAKKVREIKDMSEFDDHIDLFDVSTQSPYK